MSMSSLLNVSHISGVIVCPDAKNISQMGPMLMAMKSTKLNIGLEKEAPSKKKAFCHQLGAKRFWKAVNNLVNSGFELTPWCSSFLVYININDFISTIFSDDEEWWSWWGQWLWRACLCRQGLGIFCAEMEDRGQLALCTWIDMETIYMWDDIAKVRSPAVLCRFAD